jgi:alginate O-acetyltransferase complex protein AlgI
MESDRSEASVCQLLTATASITNRLMQFNEPTFLLLFLPVLLAVYYALPVGRNIVLLIASGIFCFWAGPEAFVTTGCALAFNYAAGLILARRRQVWILAVAIMANVALLVWCKYAAFLGLPLPKLPAPPGLSFFTFVSIAYLVDLYRGEATVIANPVHAGNYFLFFSRLWAGPIVRHRDIGSQLAARDLNRELFADGVRRFIIGLGKKVLIANTVADVANHVFSLPTDALRVDLAWLGVVAYTVQIYFDFSGYTDMAIGLGAMFGFRFPENFNYPYAATSIRDFWRRWHMTLSGWLRDYLYIPLGGSRCAPWRIHLNLLVVFTLCGLWHGAAWTFVVWGLIQGVFLLAERATGNRDLPRGTGHVYVMAVTMVSWVFFRADSLGHAAHILSAMTGLHHPTLVADGVSAVADPFTMLMLAVGAVGAFPVAKPWLTREPWATMAHTAILVCVVVLVAVKTYTPFIYQQF